MSTHDERLLWKRRIEVDIAGMTLSDPKIAIEVRKGATGTPAQGAVELFNLSPGRESRIHERGKTIAVRAGHGLLVGELFRGDVRAVVRDRRRNARVTRIRIGGALAGQGVVSGTTVRSYDGTMYVGDVITDLVDDLNAKREPGEEPFLLAAVAPALGEQTVDDFAWAGGTAQALDQLVSPFGWTWFEDDGVIRFNRDGVADASAGEASLSPDTGLIGAPTVTDEGLRVTAFLSARYRVGTLLRLTSAGRDRERWKVVAVSHSGDNWTGRFLTEMEARPV